MKPSYDDAVRLARSVAVFKGSPYTLQEYADRLNSARFRLLRDKAEATTLAVFDSILDHSPIYGGGFGTLQVVI